MSLLDGPPSNQPEDKDAWYRCVETKCDYKTKQRKGLPEVLHNCPVRKAYTTCKEDT